MGNSGLIQMTDENLYILKVLDALSSYEDGGDDDDVVPMWRGRWFPTFPSGHDSTEIFQVSI